MSFSYAAASKLDIVGFSKEPNTNFVQRQVHSQRMGERKGKREEEASVCSNK